MKNPIYRTEPEEPDDLPCCELHGCWVEAISGGWLLECPEGKKAAILNDGEYPAGCFGLVDLAEEQLKLESMIDDAADYERDRRRGL